MKVKPWLKAERAWLCSFPCGRQGRQYRESLCPSVPVRLLLIAHAPLPCKQSRVGRYRQPPRWLQQEPRSDLCSRGQTRGRIRDQVFTVSLGADSHSCPLGLELCVSTRPPGPLPGFPGCPRRPFTQAHAQGPPGARNGPPPRLGGRRGLAGRHQQGEPADPERVDVGARQVKWSRNNQPPLDGSRPKIAYYLDGITH